MLSYLFDPNAKLSLQGADIDYEEFLPDVLEMDSSLRGFNKGSVSDKSISKREPSVYMRWGKDLNDKATAGFFTNYDWLVSFGFLCPADYSPPSLPPTGP